MSESAIQREIQIALCAEGARLFRNQVGLHWAGRAFRPASRCQVTMEPGDVLIRQGRPVKAGFGPGSSDLLGWCGGGDGRFLAVEAKAQGKRVQRGSEQEHFLRTVGLFGGLAFEADSAPDAVAKYRAGISAGPA